MNLEEQLQEIANNARSALSGAQTHDDAVRASHEYLGRKGKLTAFLRSLSSVPEELRPTLGKQANMLHIELLALSTQRLQSFQSSDSLYDATLPGIPIRHGTIHPITQTTRKIIEIFSSMGFEVVDGPEVELEKYNFDLLNIPKHHPARDMQDTFYVTGKERVLRTHTSPVQIRAAALRKPPFRIIAPGRAFRHEATDASHEAMFQQCEGLYIDRDVRLTDLFGTIDAFLKLLFGNAVITRAHNTYFSFVEPGAEIAMQCTICGGDGCAVCKQSGWLEMMGCGMVHPKVLSNMGIDPIEYSGFAFGVGIDRLMMLMYGVADIRLSYANDIRFLNQF